MDRSAIPAISNVSVQKGQQAGRRTGAFLLYATGNGLRVGLVRRDRDKLDRNNVDRILNVQGVEVKVIVRTSPNLNAYVERFIRSLHTDHSCCPDSRGSFGRD
jgi:hypothetical protein